jgi:hypothetical protein
MALTASFPTAENPAGNPIVDTRRVFAGHFAAAADGTPRLGVIDPDPSTPIVSGKASMAYDIKGDVLFVTQRDSSTGGVEQVANDAVYTLTPDAYTAPVANSRIDVIWVKCQFTSDGDASELPLFGITEGVADPTPDVPSIPAGATAIAYAEVASTDTTTETVVITQVAPFTAMAGGVVPVRNAIELAAWEPAPGARAYRLDVDWEYVRTSDGWESVKPEVRVIALSRGGVPTGTTRYYLGDNGEVTAERTPEYPSYSYNSSNGRFTLEAGMYLISVSVYVHWANAGTGGHVAMLVAGDTWPARAQAPFGMAQTTTFTTEFVTDGSKAFSIEGFHNAGGTFGLVGELRIIKIR